MKPAALISVHDVMPETLPAVQESLALLAEQGIDRCALLVVPGAGWGDASLAELHRIAACGHELVAHGWLHRTRPRSPWHRVHAGLISRNVAEHLALDRAGIVELMQRSARWFADNDLAVPATYIPPAWALGRLRSADLVSTPFAVIETLRGLRVRTPDGRFHFEALPLVGFEADTPLRAEVLSNWNRLQLRRARRLGRPLRIALHPHDHQLHLARQLRAVLALGWTPLSYAATADRLQQNLARPAAG